MRLLDAGERPASQLAIDLGICRNQLYKWKTELAQVTEEREFFKKSGDVLRQGAAMKYGFMRRHTEQFSLESMCRALSASRSCYYAWCHRESSAHQRDALVLAAHVRRIHAASREAYGARKRHHKHCVGSGA